MRADATGPRPAVASVRADSVEAVRAAEAVVLAQVPDGALMQRAAAGLAAVCLRELRRRRGRATGARVVVLAGAGNNGGDALWAGARLARRGVRVDALLLSPVAHVEGAAALRAAGGTTLTVPAGVVPGGLSGGGVPGGDVPGGDLPGGDLPGGDRSAVGAGIARLTAAELVIDGIVGIGGSAGLREPARTLARVLDGLDPRPVVVAVDLPSGVDPDGGTTPAPFLRADLTVTFGSPKPCLLLPPAAHAAGRVTCVDIGLGPRLPRVPAVDRLTGDDAAHLWPVPSAAADKYARGVVGVVAGSSTYPGAAVLAVGAAVRAGAGMVRYVGPEHPTEQVRARWPEAVAGPGRVGAWTLGSGVDPDDPTQPAAVRAALAQRLPTVVDAGALTLLARPDWRHLAGPHLLLTPHAGELARLLAAWTGASAGAAARTDVEAAPRHHACRAAELTGATVLLKGAITVIATPDGRCRSQADAPAWLATAGAGDVLAGLAGTLLAAGLDPFDAAGLAALVHGRAAARAAGATMGVAAGAGPAPGGPIIASDVVAALPGAVRDLLTGTLSTTYLR